MSIEYVLTTAIAVAAVVISWMARREARRGAEALADLQARLESYEHFPMPKIGLALVDGRLIVTLENLSAKNAARSSRTSFVFRASVGNWQVDNTEVVVETASLRPLEVITLEVPALKVDFEDALLRIQNSGMSPRIFVLRASVAMKAVHPNSRDRYHALVGRVDVVGGAARMKVAED